MRAFATAFLAGVITASVCAPVLAEEDEFTADYFAGAFVELFHAHGLTVGSYGSATLDGNVLKIDGFKASSANGSSGFFADKVEIHDIVEEDEGAAPWLLLRKVAARGVNVAAYGYSLQFGDVQMDRVMLQNANSPEDQEKNGYQYIDGAVSAFRFNTLSLSGGHLIKDGKTVMDVDSLEAKASGWLTELTVPSSSSFRLTGTVLKDFEIAGLAAESNDFELKGNVLVDKGTGLTSANASFTTATSGEAVARLVLAGVNKKALGGVSKWLTGDEAAGKDTLSAIRLSRFAVAARGAEWAAPYASILSGLQKSLNGDAVKSISNSYQWLTKDAGPAVADLEPRGRLPLAEVAAEGSATDEDFGISLR